MSHKLHKFWLKVAAFVVGSFGPVFFLGTMEATNEPTRWTIDLLSWPLDGKQTYTHPDTRFLSALIGGFLVGWGITIWQLSSRVYDHAPEAVRISVMSGLICWFVLDSAGSITSGNTSNFYFNVAVLLAAAGPLWFPVKDQNEA